MHITLEGGRYNPERAAVPVPGARRPRMVTEHVPEAERMGLYLLGWNDASRWWDGVQPLLMSEVSPMLRKVALAVLILALAVFGGF